MAAVMERSAHFSGCRTYRYALWRDWGATMETKHNGYAMFVGLNPSTADETIDDQTIKRCIKFAQAWGYRALCMTNLFAYRATDPLVMRRAAEPVGPENDAMLKRLAGDALIVVAAWGVHGTHLGRDAVVKSMLPKLHYLQLTKERHPGHPLLLHGSLTPKPFE